MFGNWCDVSRRFQWQHRLMSAMSSDGGRVSVQLDTFAVTIQMFCRSRLGPTDAIGNDADRRDGRLLSEIYRSIPDCIHLFGVVEQNN